MKITESQQILQLFTQYAKEALTVGDRFTGRILSLADGLLTLQLPDGSKVNAEVKSGAEYSQGQVLRLEVVEENEGRLFVKEVVTNQAQAKDTSMDPVGILKALKLPTDGGRMEIVKAMTELGVKPSAQIIEKALNLIQSQDVTEPRQAVFLILNKMENNSEYFPLIKQFEDQSFQFHEKLQGLANKLTQLQDSTVLALADALVTDEIVQKQDLPALARQITSILNSNSVPDKTTTDLSLAADKALINTLKNVLQQMSTLAAAPQNLLQHPTTELMENKAIDTLLNQLLPGFEKADPPLQNEIVKAVADFFEQVVQEKNQQPMTAERAGQIILKAAHEALSDTSVRAQDAGLPKVDEWIEQTERKLQVISQVLGKVEGPESERLLPELRELQTAVSFFNDITSYEAFVQLPLVLKDNTTHGELYVMKRKGPRKPNAEDFSLFLSLTTMNLGTIDTFVHVQKKNIMLRVMVENEKFYPLLTDQTKALHEALKLKGFHLYELKVAPRDEELDLFNAMKKAHDITQPNQKIDIKV
ncbi:MAG: hypothetical protein KBA53_06105 [Thermoclostridium sp.]|nr:hypothetical protein [Thermoclostridium sp.]